MNTCSMILLPNQLSKKWKGVDQRIKESMYNTVYIYIYFLPIWPHVFDGNETRNMFASLFFLIIKAPPQLGSHVQRSPALKVLSQQPALRTRCLCSLPAYKQNTRCLPCMKYSNISLSWSSSHENATLPALCSALVLVPQWYSSWF